MRFKKILASLLAGALTVSAITVTSLTINAAAVTSVPSGNEKILYTADLTGKNSASKAGEDFGTVGIPISDTSIMEDENVYAKLVVSSYGSFTGDDGTVTPAKDVLAYWEGLSSWLVGVKWYNNYSTPGNFEVNFFPIVIGNQFVSYVPISDFELDEYNQIGGNLQNGNFSSVEVKSLEIVEFSESAPGEDVTLSSNIPIEELQKYESLTVTFKPQAQTECGHSGHNAGETYCTWAGVPVLGKLKNAGVLIITDPENDPTGENSSKKTDWYQPTNALKVESGKDEEISSVVVKVEDIISSFTSDKDWEADFELKSIFFGAWSCTFVSVTGKPVSAPVDIPVTGITLDPTEITLTKKGETAEITPTVTPSNATNPEVTWESSNLEAATVKDGVVTAVANGETVITAKAGDQTAECKVTVKIPNPATAITATVNPATIVVGKTSTITVVTEPADADEAGKLTYTYTSSDEKIATVKDGVITGVAAGEATITVTANENEKLTTTVKINVTADSKPAESVSITSTSDKLKDGKLALETGDEVKLDAVILPEGCTDELIWSTSNDKVATVENGTVTAVAEGTATITAKVGEKTATCEVTVTKKAVPVTGITLDKTTASVKVGGDPVQLTATVAPANADDKTVTWESSDKTIAAVDNTGKVTGVKAGKATITASAGGFTATCEVTVTAEEEKPPVTEPDPEQPAAPKLPDGYKETSTKTGKGTIEADKEDASKANSYLTTLEQSDYNFTEDQYILVTVSAPAAASANGIATQADETASWQVQLKAYTSSDWSKGWQGPQSDPGVLSVGAYISDILKMNDFAISELTGINVEVTGAPVGTEISYTVVTADKEESDAPAAGEVIWEGSKEQGTNWGWNPAEVEAVKFADAKAGDTITIAFSIDNAADYHQLKIMDGSESHNILTAPEVNKYDTIDVTEETYSFVLNEADAEALRTSGMAVAGYDVTIKTITLTKAGGSGDDEPAQTDSLWEGDQKVENWGNAVEIAAEKFAGIEKEGKIVVTLKDVNADPADTGWTDNILMIYKVTADENIVGAFASASNYALNDSGDAIHFSVAGDNQFTVNVSESLLAELKTNGLGIKGNGFTVVKAEYQTAGSSEGPGGDTPGGDDNPGGEDPDDTTTEFKFPNSSSGNFTDPGNGSSSGSSDAATTAATEAPVPGDNSSNSGNNNNTAPSVTEDNNATDTTSPYATKGEDNAPENIGNADQAPSGNTGNTSGGNVDDKNVATGIAFAFIPAAAAAAAVIISKKRK